MIFTAVIVLLALSQDSTLAQSAEIPSSDADAVVAPVSAFEPVNSAIAFEVDYLYWWLHRMRVPALLTTGPTGSQAVLGDAGTRILYGDNRLDSRHDRYIGIRLRGDFWLNDDQTFGLHGSAFFLERDSSNFTVPWNALTTLARPYVDAASGTWQSQVVAGSAPGIGNLAGSTNVYSRMELFGQDLNALFADGGDNYRIGWLLGGRFLQMRERLDITATSRLLPDEATLFGTTDHIHTFNKFFGAQTGVLGEYRWGAFSLSGKATIALGMDDQLIKTKGDRVYHTPQQRQQLDYGLYILPSNRGSFERGHFDLVSEAFLTAGWQVTSWLALKGGYSCLYWMQPVRPGDQIQPINLSQVSPGGLVGPAVPTIPFRQDSMWAHGCHVGAEVCW